MTTELSSKERVLAAISGLETDRLAVINPTSIATTESCNDLGINFKDVHLDSNKMAALAAVGFEKLGFDSVMPSFSVVQEAAALGCEIDWGSVDTMPNQRGVLFDDPDQFKMPVDYLERLPIKTVIDSIKLLRSKLGPDVFVIGKVMGPWTLSYHLHGVENFLIDTLVEPDKAREFLNKFSQLAITFIQAQFEAGADAVTIGDHATADLVSPASYKQLLQPVHQQINEVFKDKILIFHCCGGTRDRLAHFADAGFKVFHFDSVNDVDEMLKLAGPMKLTGCINNPDVLLRGGPQDVRNQTASIVAKGIKLISPECAVPLKVPNENLAEIARTIRDL